MTIVNTETATVADAESLRGIALSAGIDAWTAEGYADEIGSEYSIVLKAADNNSEIIGMLVARVINLDRECEAELYNLAVMPDQQGNGCGQRLIEDLFGIVKMRGVVRIWLEVRESNIKAIGFYKKNGFEIETIRPSFYSNPVENAIVMRLEFIDTDEVTRA